MKTLTVHHTLQMKQRGLRDCLSNNAAFFMGNHTPGLSTAAATLHQTRQAGAFKKLLDVDRTEAHSRER